MRDATSMATDLVEVNVEQPQPEVIERAAAVMRRGKVVALPGDALYTLVADPFNLRAVSGVFRAKGRETVRSLPLLVAGVLGAEELAGEMKFSERWMAAWIWCWMAAPASGKVRPRWISPSRAGKSSKKAQSKKKKSPKP